MFYGTTQTYVDNTYLDEELTNTENRTKQDEVCCCEVPTINALTRTKRHASSFQAFKPLAAHRIREERPIELRECCMQLHLES